MSTVCQDFEDRPCVKACPTSSLNHNNETFLMNINKDLCTGCKACYQACVDNGRGGCITFHPRTAVALSLSSFLDAYGIDSISLGNVLSWTMECYEKGILTKEDLDGIDLTCGNVPAMFEMTKKIIYRLGIGDLLAEGIRIASGKVGKSSKKFAMHCKGVEWGVGGAGNNRDQRETFC